jgi:hypothetical protein
MIGEVDFGFMDAWNGSRAGRKIEFFSKQDNLFPNKERKHGDNGAEE